LTSPGGSVNSIAPDAATGAAGGDCARNPAVGAAASQIAVMVISALRVCGIVTSRTLYMF
jgi:hypothetical protein